ncbi:TIGR03089 family protein [Yimella sp. cx-51]|uniref:TIGR03089 family protein n=1 Tax=Yimella sp. cx-51 TaxID=2770551 RepID=UPI00165DC15F|nr:TIGR03089 family protein [Yimella sp. cx-51]MBC9958112.1 hypothetical protein [Yimella sp. cx-51]QTH38844.1 hypothetical protein J5M86_04200 [Yimella sp. cx-51]
MRPDQLLPRLTAADPTRPVITSYDDATGERVELSAKVISMWAAKAAHWLLDEMDIAPGDRVALDFPAAHWRSVYWALGVWAVGGQVCVGAGDNVEATVGTREGDLVEPEAALGASELTSFPDQFSAFVPAAPSELALDDITYGELLTETGGAGRLMLIDLPIKGTVLHTAQVLSAGGSVVLVRNENPQTRTPRIETEAVDGPVLEG